MKHIDIIDLLKEDLKVVEGRIHAAPVYSYNGRDVVVIESAKKRYIESLIERLTNENSE